jgi:hypothetical protein
MNLEELKRAVDFAYDRATGYASRDNPENYTVVIPVYRVGSVGGTPSVVVKSLSVGFDWDRGKIFINPESRLREIDRDEIKSLQDKYDELGWKKMQIDELKREIKKLKTENEKLKLQIESKDE